MKAWEITRKDLKLLVRDVRTFVVLLALPVLFIWIIGMITGKMMGFNEPNRVLKIAVVDEIDYQALGFEEDGTPLDKEAARRLKHQARNTFVKIYNSIQEKSGFEISEVLERADGPVKLSAVAEARKQYQSADAHVALRIGPDFFKRVLRLSHRDIMDSSRGGLTFRFTPPQDLTEFTDQQAGLAGRLAPILGVQAADFELFREDIDLENAEITYQLPAPASTEFFDDHWEHPKDSALFAELAEAARPLELLDVYPSGLNFGLESLNIRLESDTPGSATHDLIEVVVLYSAFDNIKLFPLCANTQSRSQIGTSCTKLEAETDPAAILADTSDETNAIGIQRLEIEGTRYNVKFVNGTFQSIFGEEPGFESIAVKPPNPATLPTFWRGDPGDNSASATARDAIVEILNTDPKITTVGPDVATEDSDTSTEESATLTDTQFRVPFAWQGDVGGSIRADRGRYQSNGPWARNDSSKEAGNNYTFAIFEPSPPALMPPQPETESSSRVYQEVIPGYTVLFVFFLINIMARSFIHEKSLGTLRRLRIAPVHPMSLLAGKTLPFLFVSLLQTALLFLFGKFFFGMSWGPLPWLLLPVIFCTSLAATSLGLLVATVVRSESQVSAYANLVVITFGLISGSMFPRDWLPDEMRDFSLVTPHAWALIAYDEILSIGQTPDVGIILQCCVALVGFAALYFAIGTVRFGKVD